MPPKQVGQSGEDRLNLRYQDKAYNEMFAKWRRQRKDSVGFYYASNPNELTYLDGYGFVKDYPEAVERNSLRRVMNVIGVTMILVCAMELLYKLVFPNLLSMLGADIYFDKYTKTFYGNELVIISVEALFSIIKRIVPFVYVYKKMKMPIKVMIPTKITNKTLFKYSVPVMMLIVGVSSVVSGGYSKLLNVVRVRKDRLFIDTDNIAAISLFLLAHVVIIPIMSEIHTRGALLQLLRQFGDGFAIIITSTLTALISYNIHSFFTVFITSVVIGYFTVRTGSIITAVIMRMFVHACTYTIYLIDVFADKEYNQLIIMCVLAVLIAVGIFSFARLLIKDGNSFGLEFKNRYLSFSVKCGIAASSIPVIIGFTLMVIQTIININFVI